MARPRNGLLVRVNISLPFVELSLGVLNSFPIHRRKRLVVPRGPNTLITCCIELLVVVASRSQINKHLAVFFIVVGRFDAHQLI